MLSHMDNWSMYGGDTSYMLNGVFAEAGGTGFALVNDPDGISTGKALRFQSSAFAVATLRYVPAVAAAILGFCQRIWMNILPQSSVDRPTLISWRNSLNVEIAYLRLETTGRLTFSDTPGGGTTTIETTNPVMTANGWWHIESKYTRSGVGGIEVRVEGQPVILDADLGYVGAASTYQIVTLFPGNNLSGTLMYMKDYVVWDGTGAHNNNFLGSVLVYDLTTIADVALNWALTGGANGFSILDNAPPVDASYISAINPPPAKYVGRMSDLPADVTSVKGIMTMVRAAKTDGGDANLQVGVISDPLGAPVIGLGTDRPITIAQTYWRDMFEVDPKTAAAWLPSAVNLVDMQINRTA